MLKLFVSSVVIMFSVLSAVAQTAPPNFVFLLTDDQSWDQWDKMPHLSQLAQYGRRFQSFYHALPVCGPSRASLFTGMYPHNHGSFNNGTYDTMTATNLHTKTWGKVLQDAGYYTAMIGGKYVNGYPQDPNVTTEVPPGWDDYFVNYDSKDSFNYWMNDNGVASFFGTGDPNYLTEQMRIRAVSDIHEQVAAGRPFAIQLSLSCPHTPATPSNFYKGSSAGDALPYVSKPNFNPASMPGKPSFIQALPRLNTTQLNSLSYYWHYGVECGRSVDDMLIRVWQRLQAEGAMDNTYIFLTSDNGYTRGEHRLYSKGNAYLDSVRSPLFVWGPGVLPGVMTRGIVGSTDIAPTLYDLAGVPIPSWVDGRSIRPLLTSDSLQGWRRAYLTRGSHELSMDSTTPDSDNPIARFMSRVSMQTIYNNYRTQPVERDLYFWTDVYQQTNIIGQQSQAYIDDLDRRLHDLSTCAGATCRTAEDEADPLLPTPFAAKRR